MSQIVEEEFENSHSEQNETIDAEMLHLLEQSEVDEEHRTTSPEDGQGQLVGFFVVHYVEDVEELTRSDDQSGNH